MSYPKRWAAVLAALVAVLMLALPAIADTVTNNISADALTAFDVDGSKTVRYWVDATKDGSETTAVCNATSSTPLTVTINPPAGITATPSVLTFTSCGPRQNVVYTTSAPGKYPFSGTNFSLSPSTGYTKSQLADDLYVYDLESFVPGIAATPSSCTNTANAPIPTPTDAFEVGDPVCERIFNYPGGLGLVTFRFTAPGGAPVTTITPPDAIPEDNRIAVRDFQPAECGTWTVDAYDTVPALLDTDTFAVTGCGVPPELTVPADMTLDTNDPSGAIANFSVSATDVADAKLGIPLVPTCSPGSGSTFPVGTTEVTCSVTDSHGNTATGSFDVTVDLYQAAFEAPIDKPSVVNVAKVGRVIPIKVSVSTNGDADMAGPVTLEVRSWTGCGTGTPDGIEAFAPAGSSNEGNAFRWADGRWMYNLDTSGLAAGCYQGQVYTGSHLAGWFLIKLAR